MLRTADALKDLPRLGTDALGPCIGCSKVMLETAAPLFLRFRVQRCGIDAREVMRHVGLAQSIAPGRDGLALAAIMGPEPKPVVITDQYADVNVCHECAYKLTAEDIHLLLMARDELQQAADDRVPPSPPPTADEIEAAKTPEGGWDRETLAKWGVPWPPPKGWKRALLGQEVTNAADA